jgi:hypothetical protein
MPPRLYDLQSSWLLPATPDNVWAIIADVNMSWPNWWPHCSFAGPLQRKQPASNSQEDILKATTAHLNFKAVLGYTLTITIHPTKVRTPAEIDFDAGGHLVGTGRVTLTPEADQRTRMDIEWRVRPTQRWMNILSPIAAPVFKAAHAHMMHRGENGLVRTLARQASNNAS